MTSKIRMKAAMIGQKPDRIPLMCQLSLGHIYQYAGLDPVEFWLTPEGMAQGYIRLAERYRFDGILVSAWYGLDPTMKEKVKSVEKVSQGHLVTFSDGYQTLCPPDDYPRPVSKPIDPPLKDIASIDPDRLATTLQEKKAEPWFSNVLDEVIKHARPDISIHGEIGTTLERFLSFMGSYENGLMAMMEDPDKCQAILHALNQETILQAMALCQRNIDAIKLSSPFAGAGFISRDWYRKFVLPYEQELIGAIHKNYGLPCYIHTCGAIGDRLDLMIETGTDGLECLDPPPLGTTDLAQAVESVGDKIFIKGNLDSVHELSGHSTIEVKEIARKRIVLGKKAKGYILSSACSVSPQTPPENIEALYDAVEEYGYLA